MGDTIIHIETVNIGGGERIGEIMGELARGDSPEAMRDRGEIIPEDAEKPEVDDTPIEEQTGRLKMLEQRSDQDAINSTARRTYLLQLVKEVGRHRKMEGFTTNHYEDGQPNDRAAVEEINHEVQIDGQETLERACGVCDLDCEIRGDLGAWISTHAYADSDKMRPYTAILTPGVKRSESRMKFVRRVRDDPMAHCIPPEPERQQKAA